MSIPTIFREIKSFVDQQDEIQDQAFALWTWLPSYEETKKEMMNNGENPDYAPERMPSVSDLLVEATEYIAQLSGLMRIEQGSV